MTLRDGQWSGLPVFVLGGGPSLLRMDWYRLRSIREIQSARVITCNRAYLSPINPDICVGTDPAFWREYGAEMLTQAPNATHVQIQLNPTTPKAPQADVTIPILEQLGPDAPWWSGKLQVGVRLGGNTGHAALHLADILTGGSDHSTIYLFGFDCGAVAGRAWWHTGYESDDPPQVSYDRWIRDFTRSSDWIRTRTVVVGRSNLRCFPTVPLNRFLCRMGLP